MVDQGNINAPQDVRIGSHELEGILVQVEQPIGLVIFVHGSGSGRVSPRNSLIAQELQRAGFATLLFDLLTVEEAGDRANVFNVALLADRVIEAIRMAQANPATRGLRIGLFGVSTGAAAALVAAANRPGDVAAIVSCGDRPDLAASHLGEVRSPTMLIVGEANTLVLELNQAALDQLNCVKGLKTVKGATHLFDEEGTLEQVIEEARFWFRAHMEISEFARY